jgi:chromosome segregation ATPase
MERDIRYLQTSIAEAKLQVESRKTELAGLKVEFAKIDRERNAVKAHFAKVKAQAAGIEASVKQLLADNLKLTYEIARMQIEAAQKIDARTRAMAQTQEAGKP